MRHSLRPATLIGGSLLQLRRHLPNLLNYGILLSKVISVVRGLQTRGLLGGISFYCDCHLKCNGSALKTVDEMLLMLGDLSLMLGLVSVQFDTCLRAGFLFYWLQVNTYICMREIEFAHLKAS